MDISRIRRLMLLSPAALMLARFAHAETSFPSRPIRLLVGFSAGGGADTVARLYADKLQQVLNTPVIVENRPGASQLLAIRPTISAQPDGYTLFLGAASSLASGPAVRRDLPYSPLTDFSHIAMVATAPGIFVVNPELPFKTIDDVIAYAKENPGKLNYGSAGVGASNHLQMEYFMERTGVSLTHIPYKSDQEVVREVAGGSIHIGLTVVQATLPLAMVGKVRPIAVTGSQRLEALPDAPSLAEAANAAHLKDMDTYTFYGLVGPAGIPPAVVQILNKAMNDVSSMPEVASLMRDTMRCDPTTWTTAEFSKYLQNEAVKWGKVGENIDLQA